MKHFLKKNQGFSLFTVLIAVSFIGILGMLLLYIAVANFHMKTTDLKGKDSFYTAEQALEEIRTGLQQDVGEAMSQAYLSVMETYNENSKSQDATLDEIRLSSFRELYVKLLGNRLMGASAGEYSLDTLRGYVDVSGKPDFDSRESLVVTNPAGQSPVMVKSVKSGVVLKNLKVIYVDGKGRASVIETDIRLGMPKIQFPTPSTLPDLMNMIVVADSGIVCKSQGSAEGISISGSVYAGLLPDTSLPAGVQNPTSILVEPGSRLSVSGGDKLVLEGELRVEEKGGFTDSGEVTLWAQGVTLSQAEVQLLGKTYLADDLTVEAGRGSQVTVEGEYYGYGYPESARNSYNRTRFEKWTDAALSSAVVINGKDTTLDLSGVKKMMLAGKSYVASAKVNGFSAGTSDYQNDKTKNIMTGESLTVKGTQIAYLLPAELLPAGEGYSKALHNPMSYDEYAASGLMAMEKILPAMDTPVEAWMGKTLGEIGVDKDEPVRRVYYNNNSDTGYVYFYLNFTEDGAAADFLKLYYEGNPAVKANMDKYLSFYFPQENTGIRLNDAQAYLRFVTNGNVLAYDGKTGEGALTGASGETSGELLQEQTNYQNMWYALNRKMIGSYDLLKTGVTDSDGISHDETDETRSVFDNLVNEKEMIGFIKQQPDTVDWKYVFTADSDDGGFQAIMAHNGKESTFQELGEGSTPENPVYQEVTVPGSGTELVITSEMAAKLRLVVCTGDVRIQAGVHFQGIIMAKGKITLEAGASLLSAPLEAAKVFQAQMNAEEISPRDFFWEGDRYVLGNTNSTEDTSGSGAITDTYDVSQAITYENWKKR